MITSLTRSHRPGRLTAAGHVRTARDVLTAGLGWLYDTPQPAGSLNSPHGYGCTRGHRWLSFTPAGHAGWPVLVINVPNPQPDRTRTTWGLLNPLGDAAELRAWGAALTRLGYPPRDSWNWVPGGETGSISLPRQAHPDLLAATLRYRAGCGADDSVFCGAREGCSWWADGEAALTKPVWPDPVI